MRVLLLGPTPEKLVKCIQSVEDEILYLNHEVHRSFILENRIDLLISYNYRHIITTEVLDVLGFRAYNLHTSFLPFNRGAHPVLWSVLEETPLGVTIHQIDDGLDTGPIVFQKELRPQSKGLTLRQLYNYANSEIVKLFCQNWQALRSGQLKLENQFGRGTYHKKKDGEQFLLSLENSWDTTIQSAQFRYFEYLKAQNLGL